MRSVPFWNFTHRRIQIPCWRFGTNSLSHLQESKSPLGLHDPWRWNRMFVPKHRYEITVVSRVKSRKSRDLICILSVYDDIFTALPCVSTHHRYRIWEWNPVNGINITIGNKRNISLIVSRNNTLFYVCYNFNGFSAVWNRRGSTVSLFFI